MRTTTSKGKQQQNQPQKTYIEAGVFDLKLERDGKEGNSKARFPLIPQTIEPALQPLTLEPRQYMVLVCQNILILLTKRKVKKDTDAQPQPGILKAEGVGVVMKANPRDQGHSSDSHSPNGEWVITQVENHLLPHLIGLPLPGIDRRTTVVKSAGVTLSVLSPRASSVSLPDFGSLFPSPLSSSSSLLNQHVLPMPDSTSSEGSSSSLNNNNNNNDHTTNHASSASPDAKESAAATATTHASAYVLKAVTEDTPVFCERVWQLLSREGLSVSQLLSPHYHVPTERYLAEIRASSPENAALSENALTAKGLKLVTTVEAFLGLSLNESERMNAQVDYLCSLDLSDFQLYRMFSFTRNLALLRMLEGGLGLFSSRQSYKFWVERLKDRIPIWEYAALQLRPNMQLHNSY